MRITHHVTFGTDLGLSFSTGTTPTKRGTCRTFYVTLWRLHAIVSMTR